MPHKTLHCRDDEPLRITLVKAILAVSHTYTGQRHGVTTSTSANMLVLVRLQCMRHLFVANCIHNFSRQSPVESLSTNRAPLHRLSLCRSLGGAYIARPTHFRSRISKVPRDPSQSSQHSESLCMESIRSQLQKKTKCSVSISLAHNPQPSHCAVF